MRVKGVDSDPLLAQPPQRWPARHGRRGLSPPATNTGCPWLDGVLPLTSHCRAPCPVMSRAERTRVTGTRPETDSICARELPGRPALTAPSTATTSTSARVAACLPLNLPGTPPFLVCRSCLTGEAVFSWARATRSPRRQPRPPPVANGAAGLVLTEVPAAGGACDGTCRLFFPCLSVFINDLKHVDVQLHSQKNVN